MFRYAILFILCIFALTGCYRSETNGTVSPEVDTTLMLTETEVNSIIQAALAAHANPLLRNPQVDLQPGYIEIHGEHERRNGGGTISGTATVVLTVVDNTLHAEVTSANIEGWQIGDAGMDELNRLLQQNFVARLNMTPGMNVQSVTVTDSEIRFEISNH